MRSLIDPRSYRSDRRRLYLRVAGNARLNRRELGILNELATLRETVARERNIPPEVRPRPTTCCSASSRCGRSRSTSSAQLRRLDAGTRRTPRQRDPRGDRRRRSHSRKTTLPPRAPRPLGAQRDALVAAIALLVNALAAANDLPSTLLVSRAEIERIAREVPATPEELGALLDLTPWRRDARGRAALAAPDRGARVADRGLSRRRSRGPPGRRRRLAPTTAPRVDTRRRAAKPGRCEHAAHPNYLRRPRHPCASATARTPTSASTRLPRTGFDLATLPVLAEDPAREPLALRRRTLGHRSRHRRARRLEARPRPTKRDRVTGRRACCCRTSPAFRASSTSPRCATRSSTMGGDPKKINPLQPVELVIDHSVQVDAFGSADAFEQERGARVRAQRRALRVPQVGPGALDDFRAVPPDTGHRPPGEHRVSRARRLRRRRRRRSRTRRQHRRVSRYRRRHRLAHDDGQRPRRARVGRRRHRSRGRDARPAGDDADSRSHRLQAHRQAARRRHRDRPRSAVTQMLRKKGVVGKFVEFYGAGLSIICRSPIARRSATCRRSTARRSRSSRSTSRRCTYLRLTGRSDEQIALVEAYAKEQGMFRTDASPEPRFTDTLALDLATSSRTSPARAVRRIACRSAT